MWKTVSTGPEAENWQRHHMDRGFVKDKGNIFVIEAFPAGNRTPQKLESKLGFQKR